MSELLSKSYKLDFGQEMQATALERELYDMDCGDLAQLIVGQEAEIERLREECKWKSMATAPTDREIEVLAVELDGDLEPLIAKTTYHESAGFCVCSMRTEVAWREVPEVQS